MAPRGEPPSLSQRAINAEKRVGLGSIGRYKSLARVRPKQVASVRVESSSASGAIYTGHTEIAGPGYDHLNWDTLQSGDDLLDLSDPLNPVVRASGIYAVSLSVFIYVAAGSNPNDVDPASAQLQLWFDSSEAPNQYETRILRSPSGGNPRGGLSVSLTYFIPVGTVIFARASHDMADNADALVVTAAFDLAANVQRIS